MALLRLMIAFASVIFVYGHFSPDGSLDPDQLFGIDGIGQQLDQYQPDSGAFGQGQPFEFVAVPVYQVVGDTGAEQDVPELSGAAQDVPGLSNVLPQGSQADNASSTPANATTASTEPSTAAVSPLSESTPAVSPSTATTPSAGAPVYPAVLGTVLDDSDESPFSGEQSPYVLLVPESPYGAQGPDLSSPPDSYAPPSPVAAPVQPGVPLVDSVQDNPDGSPVSAPAAPLLDKCEQ